MKNLKKKQLWARVEKLEREVKALESLRPAWAQGWSSDSIAAQLASNAMLDMWEALGVSNQTDAMNRINSLLKEDQSDDLIPAGHVM